MAQLFAQKVLNDDSDKVLGPGKQAAAIHPVSLVGHVKGARERVLSGALGRSYPSSFFLTCYLFYIKQVQMSVPI